MRKSWTIFDLHSKHNYLDIASKNHWMMEVMDSQKTWHDRMTDNEKAEWPSFFQKIYSEQESLTSKKENNNAVNIFKTSLDNLTTNLDNLNKTWDLNKKVDNLFGIRDLDCISRHRTLKEETCKTYSKLKKTKKKTTKLTQILRFLVPALTAP